MHSMSTPAGGGQAMKPITRAGIAWCTVSLALIVGAAALLYFEWWVPNCKFFDVNWYDKASKEELKTTAHRVLILPFPDPHDAFLVLKDAGDVDSIPYLLWALRWQPDTKGTMICTKSHCLDALRKITGHNAGENYKEWATWWETTGRHLPPSAFPLNKKQDDQDENEPPGP